MMTVWSGQLDCGTFVREAVGPAAHFVGSEAGMLRLTDTEMDIVMRAAHPLLQGRVRFCCSSSLGTALGSS
jgi:hypothetical protein